MSSVVDSVTTGLHLRRGQKKVYEQKLAAHEILDDQDQEELCNDLKAQSEAMARAWRIALVAVGCVLGLIMTYFLVSLLAFGHAHLYLNRVLAPLLGDSLLVILLVLSIMGYASTTYYASQTGRSNEVWMLTSVVSSSVCFLIFSMSLFMKDALNGEMFWMPLANLIYMLVCVYADYSSGAVEREIRELSALRYKLSGA